jgi:hypothetical protein
MGRNQLVIPLSQLIECLQIIKAANGDIDIPLKQHPGDIYTVNVELRLKGHDENGPTELLPPSQN